MKEASEEGDIDAKKGKGKGKGEDKTMFKLGNPEPGPSHLFSTLTATTRGSPVRYIDTFEKYRYRYRYR